MCTGPCSGRRRLVKIAAATGVVFAFAALWHDARPKLFVWGLVNFVLVGLERVVGVEARARRVVSARGRGVDTVGVCACGNQFFTARSC